MFELVSLRFIHSTEIWIKSTDLLSKEIVKGLKILPFVVAVEVATLKF